MDNEGCGGFACGLFVGFVVGVLGGCQGGTAMERSAAVRAEVGRWTINENDGKSKFEYGPKKEKTVEH